MLKTRVKGIALITPLLLLIAVSVISRDLSYKVISLDKVSRYNEDRISFQHIENVIDPEEHQKQDTSIAALLIIKDKKMYLFKDGYDDPATVEQDRVIRQMENRLIMNTLWERTIDGKPDYMRITDRRVEQLKREILPGKDENLGPKYSDFYVKMRDSFIKKHSQIFKALMVNRKDSDLKVIRKPIPKKLNDSGPTKYFISVTAKTTATGQIYYAEDADGDGVTETFTVQLPDGFHWGYKSGANIIFIFQNTQEDIKAIIGDFTKIAHEGSPEVDTIINRQFDQLNKDIPILMDDLIQLDLESKRVMDEGSSK